MKDLLGMRGVRTSVLGRMILSYFPILTCPGGHPEHLRSCKNLGRLRAALGTLENSTGVFNETCTWDKGRPSFLGISREHQELERGPLVSSALRTWTVIRVWGFEVSVPLWAILDVQLQRGTKSSQGVRVPFLWERSLVEFKYKSVCSKLVMRMENILTL